MTQKLFSLSLSLMLLMSISINANAAQYKTYQMKGNKEQALVINGDIRDGEYKDFLNFVSAVNTKISSVILQSNGGYFDDALKISDYIHKAGWNTHVETYCNSSCVYMFLAGVYRKAHHRASLDVHSPYYGNLHGEYRQDQKHSKLYNQLLTTLSGYLNDKQVAKEVLERMYDTPSTGKLALNKAEQPSAWEVVNNSVFDI